MQPLRLKKLRTWAPAVALLLAMVGCESQGEAVPVTTTDVAPDTAELRPILLAQAEPSAAAPTPVTTPEATATAAVGATNAAVSESATSAPVITKEIPPARPANLKISEATEKIIKLTESNLDEKVILTFVQQTPTRFNVDADEIVYLSDIGVPSTVIAAMLKHDGDDPSKAENITGAANTENVQPAIPANTNLASVIAQTQPEPPPGVVSQAPQQIEVTTNYIPNQPIYAQQPPVVVQQQQPVVVEEAPPVVYAEPETVSYFYDSLSPYGSWFYVNDYGWCWQPTVAVVDHGWRPYGPRGHWAWTDSGWYWASDYTWGWAPFHYGRWQMAGARGWIWVPDRVWGPAWVTWRSSGDYCGWAPLPPHAVFTPGIGFTYFGRGVDVNFGFGLGYDAFCFAPFGRFHNRHVYDYCLPRHEVLSVFPHSRIENHWEFRDGRREFVNRAGPRLETGVRPAVVRTMSERDQNRFGNREHIERTSRETVIYRPPPPAPSAVAGRSGSISAAQRAATQAWTPGSRSGISTSQSATASGPATSPTRTRSSDVSTRQVTGLPAPSTTMPAPSISTPRPATSTPGIGTTEANSRVFRSPQTTTVPTPIRPAPPVAERQTPPPSRPIADASPTTRALPGSPAFNNAPPSITPPAQREFSRPQISTPATGVTPLPRTVAPPPRTVAPPPQIYSPPPRTVAPPPTTSSAPTYTAPAYTPPMRGNSPSPAPTYQAPVSRAPVYQAPASRAAEPRAVTNPNTVSPERRGRGRD